MVNLQFYLGLTSSIQKLSDMFVSFIRYGKEEKYIFGGGDVSSSTISPPSCRQRLQAWCDTQPVPLWDTLIIIVSVSAI